MLMKNKLRAVWREHWRQPSRKPIPSLPKHSKDRKEVVISNQEKRKNAIANLLTKGKLVWKHADDVSAASDVEQGLYSSQGNMSDPTTEGTDAPQTNDVQKGKLLYRFDGGAQTEQTPASVSVTTSRTNPGVSFGKGKVNSSTSQAKGVNVAENQGANGVEGAVEAAESETDTKPTEWHNDAVSGGSENTGGSGRGTEETPTLTHEEAISLIARMEERADVAPEIDLTIENWDTLFGESGIVNTPIGEVKMGENQFAKLMRQGREGKLGMIKPTLEHPHAIVEDASEAKGDKVTERASSYVFIRSFKKADGSRYYYFTSVTVSNDGKEVVISNQEKSKKRISNLLQNGVISWINKNVQSVSAAQSEESVLLDDSQAATQADNNTASLGINSSELSESKGITNLPISNELEEKNVHSTIGEQIQAAEAEVNTNPTEAQKEAGNYKKGHVKIDGYDVTIENPKGSVRRGTDASGKQWEQEMQNTYGYIRGTEGVDGDHIDVFFSDDPSQGDVFVVDQVNKDGSFDEHKVMYGFPDIKSARKAYLSNYEDGWQGLGAITPVSKEEFKKWIDSSHRKTKPFAKYSSVKPLGDTQLGEQPTAGYSIEPTTYTNKKGKTTPMHLVTFGRELSKDEIRAGKELAKESRGWWDREKGGFMMRNEDSAKALAEALSNEESVQDAQPLSVEDVRAVTDQADMKAASETINVEKEPQTTPQYDYDRENDVYEKTLTGLRNVINDRKHGAIPNIKSIENVIRDLRKRAKTIEEGMATAAGETIPQAFEALANLTGKRRAYEQLLSDIRKKMAETERDDALSAHGVKLGDKVMYNGKEATIHNADAKQVILDTGLAPVLYEVTDWENVEVPKPVKEYHGGDRVFSVKHNANKDIYMAHHEGGKVEYTFTDGTKANADEVQDALPEPKKEKTHHAQPASSDDGRQDLTTGSSVENDAKNIAKVTISKQSAKHELNKLVHKYVGQRKTRGVISDLDIALGYRSDKPKQTCSPRRDRRK